MPTATLRHSPAYYGALADYRRDLQEEIESTDETKSSDVAARFERLAVAQLRFHDRITAEEKADAFAVMKYAPTPKQWEIARDEHQIRVIRAGRRSGKTTHAAHEAAAVMLKKPGSYGWVVGPYYSLTQPCWKMLMKEIDRLEALGLVTCLVRENSGTNMHVVLDNGSEAYGKSADLGDSLQGVGLDWLVMDEIAQVESWVFEEIIFPAVIQKRGWAMLIGTPQGESWASVAVRKAESREERTEGAEPSIYKEFVYPTWENTFEFPGGMHDPEILKMKRNMLPAYFAQQVMARPQRSIYVAFNEFDETVHARKCPFDPEWPVRLSIDPSTGVNPYAVGVFQDLGDTVLMIDEFYKTQVLAVDVVNELCQRSWWANVQDAIVDDASPNEVKTWQRHPAVSFPVQTAKKPGYIEDSLPLVKAWLRDPTRYALETEGKQAEISESLFPGRDWLELEPEDQNEVWNELEIYVQDHKEILLASARFFCDRYRCPNFIDEMKGYHHKQPRKNEINVPETPVKFKDHLIDGLRYFLWRNKRSFGMVRAQPSSYAEAV